MSKIYSYRRHNLKMIAAQRGGAAALARELGLTQGRLSQLIGSNPTDEIGERSARRMEEQLGLPEGVLDRPATIQENDAIGLAHSAGTAAQNLRENLLRLLADNDISQSELARRTGMAPKAINRLVAPEDNAHSPTLETLQLLASGLNTNVPALLSPYLTVQVQEPATLTKSPNLARQTGRLVEDFLLASPEDRRSLLAAAAEAADKAAGGSRL